MKNLSNFLSSKRFSTVLMVAALLIIPVAAFAQTDINLNQATSTLRTFATQLMTAVQIIIGIVGTIMIAWVLYKRMKGDQQSNDALMGWLVALAIGILALQLIKVLFLKG